VTSLSIDTRLDRVLRCELLAQSPKESGAFCLLESVKRGDAVRYVLGRPVQLHGHDFVEHGHEVITPPAEAISKAIGMATGQGSGLAFVHTHPLSRTRPRLSRIDWATTARLGRTVVELLKQPFAALVLSPGGWAGALVADDEEPVAFERIVVSGRATHVYATSHRIEDSLDARQELAMGIKGNRELRQLRVGVVGAGGLGSPIAETLVRMGTGSIVLVDHDVLDTPSNARRVFGSRRSDVLNDRPRSKAEVVARYLNELGLGSAVQPIVGDVRDKDVQRTLLDVDLVINGTDTHSSRAAISQFCVETLIPLIDVGVRVGLREDASLDALAIERRVQVPEGPCLWCLGILDPAQIQAELLPAEERAKLVREGYLTGSADAPAPSIAALTVSAAGIATSALVALITGAFDVAPFRARLDVVSMDSVPFSACARDPNCVCRLWRRELEPLASKGA
jgi:molybdopterin/thiamine biosynthesis adenylyltransferase